jgi:hypothetical protein
MVGSESFSRVHLQVFMQRPIGRRSAQKRSWADATAESDRAPRDEWPDGRPTACPACRQIFDCELSASENFEKKERETSRHMLCCRVGCDKTGMTSKSGVA